MSKKQEEPHGNGRALYQNDQFPEDPGGGSRKSDILGRDRGTTSAESPPAHDSQGQSAIDAFGREGAGIASKE